MFPAELLQHAEKVLGHLANQGLKLTTAESCTGGLVAALLTELPGSSAVVERAFVTYSNAAKHEMIGVPKQIISEYGVVSREVAQAMAEGALRASRADIAVSVTGIAGPGGGTAAKPVGLVHVAALRAGRTPLHEECRFGDIGRSAVRIAAVQRALALVEKLAGSPTDDRGIS